MLKAGGYMKKSNRLSVFYILSSLTLFLVLIAGGVYGVYVSVGMNYMGTAMSGIAETTGTVSNVAFGGVNGQAKPTMSGIVFLSIILIVISILDLISLIKQIIFFKQFKVVRESSLEEKIERKVKSKGSVVFFTILIDIISFAAGVVGLFLNTKSFARSGVIWVLYVIDGLIVIFSLVSFVLLIAKLKQHKKLFSENKNAKQENKTQKTQRNNTDVSDNSNNLNVNDIEYKLLKLKIMKSSKLISEDEFKQLRQKILQTKQIKRKT